MLLKINYFAADEGKSFIGRVYRSRDDLFLHVYSFPYNLFSTDFLPNSLIQFFFIKV